jgi:LuxR family maltose regulon positive regulatory protein
VAQGRLGDAFAWARERELTSDDELSYLREFEHVTLARALLGRLAREPAGDTLVEATGLLRRLLDAAEAGQRTGTVLELLALEALAHQLDGDTAAALAPLERSLALAEPEGYVRLFLDLGPPMAELLRAAARHGTSAAYVGRLLRAGGAAKSGASRSDAYGAPSLSERERHVLRLLGTELGGPEIARELVLSLNTVRTHTRNIYAKLGVTNRRAAVRRAQELDLLPDRHRHG